MIFWILLIMMVINRIPILGKILRMVSTMFHELGHALMSVVTSGRVYSIYLFRDLRGMAVTGTRNWLSSVLVTIAGYPSESLIAYTLLCFFAKNDTDIMLYILFGASVFTLIFIRNFYGFFWLIAFNVINYFAYVHVNEAWVHYYLMGIVLILISESIYSAFTIMYLSFRKKQEAGDAYQLAQSTMIPTIIWGLLFFSFSLYMGWQMVDLLKTLKITVPFS